MKKRIFLGIGAIVIIAVLVYLGYTYYYDKSLLREAHTFFTTAKFKEAEEKYMEYILRHPDDLEERVGLVACLSKQDKFDQAMETALHVKRMIEEKENWISNLPTLPEEGLKESKQEIINQYGTVNAFLTEIYLRKSEEKYQEKSRMSSDIDYGKKMLKKAEEHLAKASQKERLLPSLQFLQARWDYAEGEYDQALAKLLKIKKQYPDYWPKMVDQYIEWIKDELRGLQSKKIRQADVIHVEDSKEKVKAILGNPNSISKYEYSGEEAWEYSGGSIRFRGGYVTEASGIEIDPFPRKAKSLLSPKASKPSKPKPKDIVHIADTEETVKAILGNPASITRSHLMDYWWYGGGYIEFSSGKVVGANGIKIDRSPRKEVQ